MKIFLTPVFTLLCLLSLAQNTVSPVLVKKFTREQLASDFFIFKSLLEKAHPSLYRYTSKDSMDCYFEEAEGQLNHPMNELEFWQILQSITTKVRCLHTQVELSKSLYDTLNKAQQYALPFHIVLKDDRLLIKDNIRSADTLFKPGDEILAINESSAKDLLTRFRALLSHDGNTFSLQNYKLQEGYFNKLYFRLYPLQTNFTIVVKSPNDSVKTINWKRADSLLTAIDEDSVIFATPKYTIAYPKEMRSTAWLKINSFYYRDYLDIHKKIFKEIKSKHIKNVVVDLQGNHGGLDNIAIDLLKYLIDTNFYFIRNEEIVVDIDKFATLNSWGETIADPGLLLSVIDHKLNTRIRPANGLQKPYKKTFKGNVYLLIDGGTLSAGSLFAVALKKQRNCIAYGQETGGTKAGCNGGRILNIMLPQTELRLLLPMRWANSASFEPDKGEGLMPDVELGEDEIKAYLEKVIASSQ